MPIPHLAYRPTMVTWVQPVGCDSLARCLDPIDPASEPILVAVPGRPSVGDQAEVAWVAPTRAYPKGRWAFRRGKLACETKGATFEQAEE